MKSEIILGEYGSGGIDITNPDINSPGNGGTGHLLNKNGTTVSVPTTKKARVIIAQFGMAGSSTSRVSYYDADSNTNFTLNVSDSGAVTQVSSSVIYQVTDNAIVLKDISTNYNCYVNVMAWY